MRNRRSCRHEYEHGSRKSRRRNVVRRSEEVDKEAGKITIKHGPLVNLGMPAMTMVFHVADPAMLEQVKPGDKIAFAAEMKNGALTVVKMEAPQ